MCHIEPLKSSNAGWLVNSRCDAAAFGGPRTADPALLTMLADPQWNPCLVFSGEFAATERVVAEVQAIPRKTVAACLARGHVAGGTQKFSQKSPFNHLTALNLQPEKLSRYQLRRSTTTCAPRRWPHCTSLGG